jgi:Uri superfamily endonuclease
MIPGAIDESDSGLYVIIMSLRKPVKARVGALGMVMFERGNYLYIGSAMRFLAKRVARHKKRTKPLRWHIDYFRKVSRWEGSLSFIGHSEECELARLAQKAVEGNIAYSRFGSSDCRCPGHLIHTTMDTFNISENLKSLKDRGGF